MVFMRLLKKLINEDKDYGTQESGTTGNILAGALAKMSKDAAGKKLKAAALNPVDAALEEVHLQFQDLIQILKEEYSSKPTNPFRSMCVARGVFEGPSSEDEGKSAGKSPGNSAGNAAGPTKVPYVFLRVPGRQGFLMEKDSAATIALYRGRESVPLLWNESTAESSRPTVVSRSTVKWAEIDNLDHDLWRVSWLAPENATLLQKNGQALSESKILLRPGRTLSTSQLCECVLATAVEEMGG